MTDEEIVETARAKFAEAFRELLARKLDLMLDERGVTAASEREAAHLRLATMAIGSGMVAQWADVKLGVVGLTAPVGEPRQ